MDVYEEEFGDLLVVNTRRTVQQQFYGDTMKRLVRLYSFLPAELLECRMQKYWEKFLERNPNLRKKHKAEMKAIRALCPSANLSKVPQRKSLKRLGANLRRARAPQQAAKRTSGGSNAQANLSRPQNGRKGVVEQRYMPLDIRVTRSPPATVEPDKLSMAANQAAEEPEEAEEKRMNENLPAVSEMTATKTGNAPRQDDARPDIVAHFEENKLSLAAGTEGDTKHATSSWSPTHRVHNAAHDGPLNVQANASILEPLQQQRGTAGEHAPEGRAHVSDSRCKPDGHPNGRDAKETATSGHCLHKQAPMDSSAIVEKDDGHGTKVCTATAGKQERDLVHFTSQLTVSISPSVSDKSGKDDNRCETHDHIAPADKKGSVHFASQLTVSISPSVSDKSGKDDNRCETHDYTAPADKKGSVHFASQLTVSVSPSASDDSGKVGMARVSSDSTDSGMKKEGTMRLGKPEPSVSDCAQAESGNKENVVEQSEAGCTRGWKMQSHGISGPERAAAPKGLLACNAEKRKRNKLSLPKPNRTPEAAAHTTPNDSQSTETRSLQEPSSRGNSAGVANTSAPEGHEKTQVKTPRKLSSISEPKSGATKRAIESSSHTQQNAGITTPALPKRMHGETTKEAGRNVQSGPLTSSIANEETGRAQKDVMAQFAAHEKTPEELSRKLGTQAVSKVAANKGTIKESYKTQRDATVNSGAQMKKTDRKIAKVAGSQAKGRSPAGKESYVEDRNDAKQAPKARSMALDEGRANTKGMLKKRAGTHEKTGPVASSRSPKSKENATTNTSLTSPAPPQPKRLRDKTPRNVTSRSGGLATPEGGASPPNKPARGKPAGGAAASQMAGEKSGKMVTKDAFETPNVARPTRPQFPPTPLKQRAPKKTTLEKTPKQSTKERLAVSEELQSDPETPFGFKLKRLKLELERCDLTEQMLHTQKESLKDEHEKDQAVLCTKRTRAEARPARDDGCKLGDSGKGRHKAGKNNKCLKSSSTTQPEILARSDEEKAGNASEQPGLSRSFEDKMSNALSTEPSRSSVAANAKNAKQQLGIKSSNTSADTGETSQRSSQNLGGLTQNPNVEGRPREAHNKLFLVETKAGAFEFGKEDGFPSFMGALDERALYSQMETKKEMYTAAARDAFLMEANMEKGPANTKQKAEQRHGLTGVNEQCIAKPNRQKRGRAFEDASSLNINCDDNTSTFFDFDTPAAERCEPSTSFFQMKLMPTPLSFSDDRNEDDADEVFPWLASSSPRSTADTQKRGIASQRDDARGSHLKRTNPGASTSAGSDLVWPSQEPPGHIVSRNKHDDTESDSEYGEFPPLMSRMQVAASDAASDDEYEHALDDDFPPLETP